MYCPPEVAESFLQTWHDESTVLLAFLKSWRFSVTMGGTVTEFEMGSSIKIAACVIESPSGEIEDAPGEIMASLEGVSFEYVEPREAPPEMREEAEAMVVCLLTIKPLDPKFEYVLELMQMRDPVKDLGSEEGA